MRFLRLRRSVVKRVAIAMTLVVGLGAFVGFANSRETLAATTYDAANLDKLKVTNAVITSRKTGTDNTFDAISDNDGHDASADDDYIRTYDYIYYEIEVAIAANEAAGGSTTTGGILKAKVTLPTGPNGEKIMTIKPDTWMKGVPAVTDSNVLTAYYEIARDIEYSSRNQRLTFTIAASGLELEPVGEPTFEFWMEGNKPDNSASVAESIKVSDDKDIIITARPSFNAKIRDSGHAIPHRVDVDENGVGGIYHHFSVSGTVYQNDGSSLSSMLGLEMPGTAKVEMKYKIDMMARPTNNPNLPYISVSTDKPLNGAYINAYSLNNSNGAGHVGTFTPATDSFAGRDTALPGGNSASVKSGNMTATLEGDILTVTYENFTVVNPIYTNSTVGDQFGFFAIGAVQVFYPLLDGENDYEINYNLIETTYTDSDGNFVTKKASDDEILDSYDGDDSLKVSQNNTITGDLLHQQVNATPTFMYFGWGAGGGVHQVGQDLSVSYVATKNKGPFLGGHIELLLWETNYTTFEGEVVVNPTTGSNFTYPASDVKLYYGIYKADPEIGLTTVTQMNLCDFDDFDWYETFEEAKTHGAVTAIKADDPKNQGFSAERVITLNFKTSNDEDIAGEQAHFREKFIAYIDEERTRQLRYGDSYWYNSANSYTPSKWSASGDSFTRHSNIRHGETVTFTDGYTEVKIFAHPENQPKTTKTSYNVSDFYVNYRVEPVLKNGFTPNANDKTVEKTVVQVTIPEYLEYRDKSASKAPSKTIYNMDGTTTIAWEYEDLKINAEIEPIEFQAKINEGTPNNSSLQALATIKYDGEMVSFSDDGNSRNKKHHSEFTIKVSNLASSYDRVDVPEKIIERNASFNVVNYAGNTTDQALTNARVLEILPKNGDSKGSSFFGSYTIKASYIPDGQKMYYTTSSMTDAGITTDSQGHYITTGISLGSDSKWIEAKAGDTVPANATMLIHTIAQIPANSTVEYSYAVTTNNNKAADTYVFDNTLTASPLVTTLTSNKETVTVINRKLGGVIFLDENDSGEFDEGDYRFANATVELLDLSGNVIRTTTTKSDGTYEFDGLDRARYTVQATLPKTELDENNIHVMPWHDFNETRFFNNAGQDYQTPIIKYLDKDIDSSNLELSLMTVSVGVTYKLGKVISNHFYEDETDTPFKTVVEHEEIRFGETYQTHKLADEELEEFYQLCRVDSAETGVVEKDLTEVNYYYCLPKVKLITHHVYRYRDGTESEFETNIDEDLQIGDEYSTEQIDESELLKGYTLVDTEGELYGVMGSSDIEATYYYELTEIGELPATGSSLVLVLAASGIVLMATASVAYIKQTKEQTKK